MPDKRSHLAQANHNDQFARKLVNNGEGPHDWAVTVTFYAALHYLESWLIGRGVDVVAEARTKGRISPHTVRVEKAKLLLAPDKAIIFTQLRQQSELARYLTTTRSTSGGSGPEITLPDPPNNYFEFSAKRYYEELEKFKESLGLT